MATRGAGSVDRDRWPYRMKDLCELTGLDRQTVHFYIAKQLVPEGHKTGRNMAYYGEEHLERLRLVLELKHERFLPLDTIRAVLNGEDEEFTPEQRGLLVEEAGGLRPAPGAEAVLGFYAASIAHHFEPTALAGPISQPPEGR